MRTNDFVVVGVGASAGGQASMKDFFTCIPRDIPAAFVVVTHLHRDHESHLADILSRQTTLSVEKIKRVTLVEPGKVYVLPESHFVKIKGTALYPTPRPALQIINKSVDFFFDSLAKDQKENAIGVILSGMGTDGSEGAQRLFEYGGHVFVQAPTSTQFSGMPCATVMNDHPEFVLPPTELGSKLVKFITERKAKSFESQVGAH